MLLTPAWDRQSAGDVMMTASRPKSNPRAEFESALAGDLRTSPKLITLATPRQMHLEKLFDFLLDPVLVCAMPDPHDFVVRGYDNSLGSTTELTRGAHFRFDIRIHWHIKLFRFLIFLQILTAQGYPRAENGQHSRQSAHEDSADSSCTNHIVEQKRRAQLVG
jgi:hypothetical protein